MKICFFNLNRLSFEGGAENYINSVGTGFVRQGHQVYYLGDCRSILKLYAWLGFLYRAKKFKDAYKDWRTINGLPSIRPGSEGIIKYKTLFFNSLIPFSGARYEVKSFLDSCDVILVKNELAEMIFFRLLGRKYLSKAALIIFTSIEYKNNDFRSRLHNFFYCGWLYKKLLKYKVIIVSNKYEQELIAKKFHYPPELIYYIPYGLENENFYEPKIKKIGNKFTVLFIGRLEEQKGVDLLPTIWQSLSNNENFGSMQLLLAGDGPRRELAENLANSYDNVEYLGLVEAGKVIDLYKQSDLVLMPSRWETFGYVCLEANACGVPVIAFDVPGPQDIIQNGQTGHLVHLGDLDKIKERILYYYSEKQRNFNQYFYLKQQIITKTKKRFSIERVLQDWHSLFINVFQ